MGVTSTTAQQHQSQLVPSTIRAPPRPEHLNGRSSTKQSTLLPQQPFLRRTPTHVEAQFEFLSPQKWKQLSEKYDCGSRKSNSSQRQRYQKEAITAAIRSGMTAVVEKLSFAMGGRHRQRYRKKAVTTTIGSGTTAIESGSNGGNSSDTISVMRFGGDELSFTKWG
ncbi:hypothetical protein DEO72_LG8g1439 [Vigna unguiculata]|uniref:Uncharacterized protein n=1 Tax=Vigna unguiculata TaxID=3917 RepID=A0A4D6MU43_VIGUN|nr:hypothetical protein DEO72_LG8g1439 [Vigna unguiculata]